MAGSVVVDTSRSPYARLRPVPVGSVRLDGGFWAPRLRRNREVALPAQLDAIERTGRLDNFRRAAGLRPDLPHQGYAFNDSDVYKWLEGAAWALAAGPDPELTRLVDDVIATIGAAQQPDGYLNTFYARDRQGERWTDLANTHELYCAGHLIQAAIAHHRSTGQTTLLEIARRFADCVCDTFGPAADGQRPGTDGHQEIELALVELARETGDPRYLAQARYFLDARGHGLAGGDAYRQDHRPFRELETVVGHAVRAVYYCAGAADVYAETGEAALLATLERLWRSMAGRRIYVTGGLGARHEGESFGADYELPNARAYAETCAAIASVMWNWRMLLITGEARYADLLEWTLYNGVLPGVSLDGGAYFYDNPLADDGSHRRQPWYACACCPPNVARLLASLPGYLYGVDDDGVWVHLYAQGSAEIALPGGNAARVTQRTEYPRDGAVRLELGGAGDFALRLRIPDWAAGLARVAVNGVPLADLPTSGYVAVRRRWRPGDMVDLSLPVTPRLIEAHPYVTENAGRLALARGPILYCLEQGDNPDLDLRDVRLAPGAGYHEARSEGLDGVVMLHSQAQAVTPSGWDGQLYRAVEPGLTDPEPRAVPLTWVPYYAWANREPGQMRVWVQRG